MNATLLVSTRPPCLPVTPVPSWQDDLDESFDGDAEREWQAFLALGQRVDAAILAGKLPWRHPPVLLSF